MNKKLNYRAKILFVVEDVTYNISDQRFIEFGIQRLNPNIKIIRRNLTELVTQAKLGPKNELIVWVWIIVVPYFQKKKNNNCIYFDYCFLWI